MHRGAAEEHAGSALQARGLSTGEEVHLPGSLGRLDAGEAEAVLADELVRVQQHQTMRGAPPADREHREEVMPRGRLGPPLTAIRRAVGDRRLRTPVDRSGAGDDASGSSRPPDPADDAPPEPVPPSLERKLSPALGRGTGAVRVHRDAADEHNASALQARGLSTGEEVHLPGSLGRLDAGEAEAVLAHELVHVQQHRTMRGALPDERSPAGQALERQAIRVERAVRQGQPLPAATPGVGPFVPYAAGSVPEPPAPPMAPPTYPDTHQTFRPRRATHAPIAEADEGPGAVDELADRVYEHIRDRLRAELLVDRERAGLLTDAR